MPKRCLPKHQNHLFRVHRFQLDRFTPDPFGVGTADGGILAAALWPIAEVLERKDVVDDLCRNAARQRENAGSLW